MVVISYYDDLHRVADLLRRSGMPRGTPVFYGNYYGSLNPDRPRRRPRRGNPRVIGGRNAPMFTIVPSTFHQRRRLTRAEKEALGEGSRDGLEGPVPSLKELLAGGGSVRNRWGRELGRRFRDRLRQRRRSGAKIANWQFDEIIGEAYGRSGRALREYIGAILSGITFGRPGLGDRREPGLVFVARRALPLATRRPGAELNRFWRTLNQASRALIGEEYPDFEGDPPRVAVREAVAQRSLRRGGGARTALARKYVAGITPGYVMGRGLGGNVNRWSRARVNRWRAAFVRQRARMRVAGFALFHLRFQNGRRWVLGDALKAVAAGTRALTPRRRRSGGRRPPQGGAPPQPPVSGPPTGGTPPVPTLPPLPGTPG